jgi:hypothetical protein
MSERDRSLRDINSLYGIPGSYDCEQGHRMLIETISELGEGALTDEAISLLARKHRAEEAAMVARYECEDRQRCLGLHA